MTHESRRGLALQSEEKRKQASQSEANVCQRVSIQMQSKKTPFLIGQDSQ